MFGGLRNSCGIVIFEAVLTISIMYGDIVTDVIVNIDYYENGDTYWFTIGMICLSLSYLLSFGFGCVILLTGESLEVDTTCNRITVFILGVLWLAPAIPVYDLLAVNFGFDGFFAEKDDAENFRKPPQAGKEDDRFRYFAFAAKAAFKVGEMVVESIPQSILQTYVILHQEDYDRFQVFSVCLSFMSVALSVYVSYGFGFLFDQDMNKLTAAIFEGVYVAYVVLSWALFAWAFKEWIFVAIPLTFGIEAYFWLFFTNLPLSFKIIIAIAFPLVIIAIALAGVLLPMVFLFLYVPEFRKDLLCGRGALESCTAILIYLPYSFALLCVTFSTIIFSPIILVMDDANIELAGFDIKFKYVIAMEIWNVIFDIAFRFALIIISLEYYHEFDPDKQLPSGHDETESLIYISVAAFSIVELVCGCIMISRIGGSCSLKSVSCCGAEESKADVSV